MAFLWIVLVLAALIVLICLTRVGVRAALRDGELFLSVTAGPLHIQILPAGEKPKKEKKPKKKKPPSGEGEAPEKKDAGFKLTPSVILDAVRTLWPPLLRALRRLGRGIRIKPLRASLTLGGREDPAEAAQLCGKLQAAVWTAMPALEQLIDIREPFIHIGVDFDRSDTAAEGEIGVTLRIGTALAMGAGVGIPALRWFLRTRRQMKRKTKPEGERTAPAPEQAA